MAHRIRISVMLLAFLAAGCGGPPPAKGPNLLLVTLDTLRKDAVGCYGAEGARTPVLDGLAREGVQLSNAQIPVPLTLPSHTTMMTGLYPASHGVRVNALRLPEGTGTLAEALAERGYDTAAFVASQVLSGQYGIDRGFATYDDGWIESAGDNGIGLVPQRRADDVVRSFLEWFGARERGRPFFAWVHFYDVHSPYDPPAPFAAAAGGTPYAGEVAYADRSLGRVLEALDAEGLRDSTLIVVLSDHGEGLGDHDEESHGFLLYETTVSVPWIVRVPGGAAGKIVTGAVESVDLLPTLAEFLPIRDDDGWAGKSFAGALRGETPGAPERPLYAETYFGNVAYEWAPLRSLREGDWKLVTGGRDALYDLAADPDESADASAENPGVVARLHQALDGLREDQPERSAEELEVEVSPEERTMLEALGYVAPTRAISDADTLPDTRDYYRAHALIVGGKRILAEGRVAEAKADFEEACAIDPRNITALSALADCYRREKDLPREEKLLRRILDRDRKNAAAWNNLANVILQTSQDARRAITCYDQSIAGDSTYAEAYVNRANLFAMQGNYDEAERGFRAALRFDSKLAIAHWGLANIYGRRGDFEKHIMELKLALRADPDFTPAREKLESYGPGFGGDRPPPGIGR